jgi:hypothetical protein
MTADGRASRMPGEALLHPLAVAAVAILLLNDHVMKQAFPGWLTGKASDFAGLVVFPLLALSIYEMITALLRKPYSPSRVHLNLVLLITGVAFTLVKLIPAVGDWYSVTWGWLSAPVHGSTTPVALVQDPTDLLTLPALLISSSIGRARLVRREESRGAADPQLIGSARREGVEPQPSDP